MKYITFGVLVLVLVLVPAYALGAEFRANEQVSLPAGQSVEDDLYAAGSSVNISGEVKGDLFAAGGSVIVKGAVAEDLVAAGGTLNLLGEVEGDLRAGGGTVLIHGTVGGDVLAGGGEIDLGAEVRGDVAAGGGVIRVEAPVGGDLRIGGGEVYLNSSVQGDVWVNADKLILGSGAVIMGALKYRSPLPVVMEEGARVQGEVSYERRPAREEKDHGGKWLSVALFVKFLMLLAGSLILGLSFRRYSRELVQRGFARPLANIGLGLVFLIVAPIVSVLLMVTVIGIPLGMLGLLTYIAFLILSTLLVPLFAGSLVYKWIKKGQDYVVNWKTIVLGAFVFGILCIIPFLGWLLSLGFVLFALGEMLRIKWELAKGWK